MVRSETPDWKATSLQAAIILRGGIAEPVTAPFRHARVSGGSSTGGDYQRSTYEV